MATTKSLPVDSNATEEEKLRAIFDPIVRPEMKESWESNWKVRQYFKISSIEYIYSFRNGFVLLINAIQPTKKIIENGLLSKGCPVN